MSEYEFLYDATLARLRTRCRWAGPLVALITLLPYEVIDERPQFLWDLAGELPPAGLAAYLAPAVAGTLVFLGSYVCRRAASLAILVLAAMLGATLVIRLGADASAWDILALPESITDRPQWALLALALVSAGTVLAARPHARRLSRFVLGGAALLAAVFYLWPAHGEAPIATIVRVLGQIDGDLPAGLNVGFVFLALLAAWPGIMALLGLLHLRWPPSDGHPVLAIAAIYGMPALLGTMLLRGFMAGAGVSWFVFLGGLFVLGGLLSLLAAAFEGLFEGLFAPVPEADLPRGLRPRRAFGVAGGVLAVVLGAQAWAALPPEKGVDWPLQPPNDAGDVLFGELLPAWDAARLSWDRRVRQDSSAQAMVEVKGAARAMIEAARPIDARLASALESLARESSDLGLAGRRWNALVAGVNEASRRAGLPYYLDPTAYVFQTAEGLRRHFRVRPYRIDRVRRFAADGDPFATLHVTRLDVPSGNDTRLGFSRDVQPFALVATGEIDGFQVDLAELASADPPRCSDEAPGLFGPEGAERCGLLLAEVLKRAGGDLAPALVALTERHELQHQIDGPHLPLPALVLKRLGRYNERVQRRASRELSAYLAEMLTTDAPPQLGLIHLYRFVLTSDRGNELEVAVLAFSALTGRPAWEADGEVDRDALAEALEELAALSDDALRARVASAWADLYGRRVAAIEAVDAAVAAD